MDEIYLDNSATTRPLPEVIKKINQVLKKDYGNPSSPHKKGARAEQYLRKARNLLATRLEVTNRELYFTSGGTESNNLAIRGTAYNYKNRGQHLITTTIEHASVFNVFKALEEEGFSVSYLQPDKRGLISPQTLKKALTPETILVSIMQVNNELGSIQPVGKFSSIIKNYNEDIFFHVDAVQACGKIPVKPKKDGIDLLSLSGHKFHGPKGTGILYFQNGMLIRPLFEGGGQENYIRSGTENVPGIAGLIPALDALPQFSEQLTINKKLNKLKKHFIFMVKSILPEARINTPRQSAPHIINLSFQGIKGEVLVHALEEENIFISTGAACHSRNREDSRVLEAINLPPEYREGTIRVSLSEEITEQQLEYTVNQLKDKLAFFNI